MSRLSNDELASAERICNRESIADYPQGAVIRALSFFGPLVREVKERRAADLTAQDLEALSWVRDVIRRINSGETRHVTALAVLDKLLAREAGR